MKYAEAGYNLEIDLSTRSIEREATDAKLIEPKAMTGLKDGL